MNRLFWGLIFVLLDWKVTLGTATVGLLPDFLGFYLIMKGMESLGSRSNAFNKGRHLAFGLAILSAILYGADLMNPDTGAKVVFWALGLVALAGMLILLRLAVTGCAEMGKDNRTLFGMWQVLAVLQSICYLANWIPLVGAVCGYVSLGVGVLFLICFYTAIKKSAA